MCEMYTMGGGRSINKGKKKRRFGQKAALLLSVGKAIVHCL